MERGNKPLPPLTPREELSRERRHASLTSFLKQNNLTIKRFLELYKSMAILPDMEVNSTTQTTNTSQQEVNSADYAIHHYEPMSKWKQQ